jgi:hypothetical protein
MIVGLLAIFQLIFFHSNAITIENATPNGVHFAVSNSNNISSENYNIASDFQYNYLSKTSLSHRKYGENETNNFLYPSDNSFVFHFTYLIIVVDFKNSLLQTPVSLSYLRGPPIPIV